MTESKEWVTIKIPKSVRDKAKEHDDTYGEIMTAGLDGSKDVGNGENGGSNKLTTNPDVFAEQVVDLFTAEVYEPAEGVNESEIARKVTADLKAELPEAIADELQR